MSTPEALAQQVKRAIQSPAFDYVSMLATIFEDYAIAAKRQGREDTPTHRREVIRSAWFAIEAQLWLVRRMLILVGRIHEKLTSYEETLLRETGSQLKENGTVREVPNFLPVTSLFRLATRLAHAMRPDFPEPDYGEAGWCHLAQTVKVRNRLVHPKSADNLNVSDNELKEAASAEAWARVKCASMITVLADEFHAFSVKLAGGSIFLQAFTATDRQVAAMLEFLDPVKEQ